MMEEGRQRNISTFLAFIDTEKAIVTAFIVAKKTPEGKQLDCGVNYAITTASARCFQVCALNRTHSMVALTVGKTIGLYLSNKEKQHENYWGLS